MKIYTKRGDGGMTDLPGGKRVSKSHSFLEALGAIDELNSCIGLLRSFLPDSEISSAGELRAVQETLLRISSALCGSPVTEHDDSPAALENAIDRMEEKLPPLRHFILPGGNAAAATAHLTRTVCRRAERRVAELVELEKKNNKEIPRGPAAFLNRLSDYLFVLARHLNRVAGTGDDDTGA